ncbi:MAG: type II toxin-antitoxin system RelE/ParE family toxin [Flavobacteriales bacterium]|nr:type II toxin-antitoxin system RelE/ParE family toxin [Flavobacteriales bacterium]
MEIATIKTNPELFAVKYKQTRVAVVKRFPYGIHYVVEKDRIVILAILHTSRSPKLWKGR